MATWIAIREWLEKHGTIERDGDRAIVVGVTGPSRRVRVELVTAFDEPWILLTAAIIEEAHAAIRDALAFNARLAVGSLALDQGWLVLRAAMPLDGSLELLDRTVILLASESARMSAVHAVYGASPDNVWFVD